MVVKIVSKQVNPVTNIFMGIFERKSKKKMNVGQGLLASVATKLSEAKRAEVDWRGTYIVSIPLKTMSVGAGRGVGDQLWAVDRQLLAQQHKARKLHLTVQVASGASCIVTSHEFGESPSWTLSNFPHTDRLYNSNNSFDHESARYAAVTAH